ncbi:MAG: DUF2723 domain-containing protein [Flavobacteriales bacterium]
MQFKKLNIVTGWLVFVVATITYLLTIEPTASFWDCGEFIATAYRLEVGHPPGAPLFMLLARIASAFVAPETVPMAINSLSALCSSFTILFLFWSITHLALKLAVRKGDEELTTGKIIAVIGSGIVGALAYTWSDSFWFSAVEGEVYSMSSLFTAVVFWAILKWESEADQPHNTRWLILISYLIGLSIGVQLLGLLCIPAIALVYYFRKYKTTTKGIVYTMLIGAVILGSIQAIIIPGIVKVAGWFELLFVNDFGLPFNTGTMVYGVLIVGLIVWALMWTQRTQRVVLNTVVLCVSVILLGYSTYAMTVVRSHANPPIDENNPENVFNLVSYLNREQYGDRPLLIGQFWDSPPADQSRWKDGTPVHTATWLIKKGSRVVKRCYDSWSADHYMEQNPGLTVENIYEVTDKREHSEPSYEPEFTMLFPRMYSSQGGHVSEYKSWAGFQDIEELQLQQREAQAIGDQGAVKDLRARINEMQSRAVRVTGRDGKPSMIYKPGQSENIRFFMDYQVNWMYWRYFLWNFAGRQNDIQGTSGGITEGNWLSGIDAIDEARLGEQSTLPPSMKNNKGFNKLFLLPMILGLIGLVYQLTRNLRDWSVVMLLFFFTGLAIVIYLNQTPLQPRERDYAYVGSFYAFAVWIGLGVYALFDAARNIKTKELLYAVGAGGGLFVLKFLVESMSGSDHSASYSLLYITLAGGGALFIFHFLGKAVKSDTVPGVLATLLCIGVPLQMLRMEWDDHSRANRVPARDVASNYLNSCAPNAILFTNGDNDTFPLWYAQEVQGIRTDVRVVNLSLLNTDWYIDQMRRKAYDSDPVPFNMAPEKYRQGTRDAVYLLPKDRNNSPVMDLKKAVEYATNDANLQRQGGDSYATIPTNRFSVPIDSAKVIANGTVSVADSARIAKAMVWTIGKQAVYKNHFLVMDLLAHNNWDRPIYFAVTTGPDSYINMQDWFQLEGLTYRISPIMRKSQTPGQYGHVAVDMMLDNVMNKFKWGNMDTQGAIYLDENILRMTMNLRMQMSALADALTDEGRKEEAIKVIDLAFEKLPERNVPYDRVILPLIEAYYDAGATAKANVLAERLFDIMDENMQWQLSLDDRFYAKLGQETSITRAVMARMVEDVKLHGADAALMEKLQNRLTEVEEDYKMKNGMPTSSAPGERPTTRIKF